MRGRELRPGASRVAVAAALGLALAVTGGAGPIALLDARGPRSAAPTPTLSPPPPNEPPGFRPAGYVPFEGVPVAYELPWASPFRPKLPDGWKASSTGHLGVEEDPGVPGSPPYVARATFLEGIGDGVSPIWLEREIRREAFGSVFVAFWLKLSEHWQGHATGVNKVIFVWSHGKPVAAVTAVGSGGGPLHAQVRLQDVPGEPARNLTPNVGTAPIVRGGWQRWEVLLVSNRPGLRDGEAHWWIDGEKVGEHRSVVFAGPAQDGTWELVAWRPVWGGRGDRVRETMYMWMDDLYVSGAP